MSSVWILFIVIIGGDVHVPTIKSIHATEKSCEQAKTESVVVYHPDMPVAKFECRGFIVKP